MENFQRTEKKLTSSGSSSVSSSSSETSENGESSEKIKSVTPTTSDSVPRDSESVSNVDSSTVSNDKPKNLKKTKIKYKKPAKKNRQKSIEEQPKEEHILGIYIHKTDTLKFKKFINAPKIKISIFDQNTGNLLKKSGNRTNVILNKEPEHLDFILPIISAEGQLVGDFSFSWNELIIVNEDFAHITANSNIVMFFEIINIAPNTVQKIKSKRVHAGWYHVCWAFFRISSDEYVFGDKIKLQLYKYVNIAENQPIVKQWKRPKRKKYPAILEVTLQRVLPKYEDVGLTRPFTALQKDRTSPLNTAETATNMEYKNQILPSWPNALQAIESRFSDIPHKIAFECRLGGSCTNYAVKKDGKYMAYTENCANRKQIVVRKLSEVRKCFILRGHNGVIHSLEWWEKSNRGGSFRVLTSASEDKTCIIWHVSEKSYELKYSLPHPSFLYCSTFGASQDGRTEVVTGGRDEVLRIWSVYSGVPRILQELKGHDAYIISAGYSETLKKVFSADIKGAVIEWNWADGIGNWILTRKIELKKHLKQFIIHEASFSCFALAEQLLVKIDMRTGLYYQILRSRIATVNPLTFAISRHGPYVLLASQRNVYCYNQFSENQIFELSIKSVHNYVTFLQLAPQSNLLAVSSYNTSTRCGEIVIYGENEKEEAIVISPRIQDPNVERPTLRNLTFSEILNKLDNILTITKGRRCENFGETNEKHDGNQSDQNFTFSIKSSRTFVVGKDVSVESDGNENRSKGTYTVSATSGSTNTDASENLVARNIRNSASTESVSTHNTNKTIIVYKGKQSSEMLEIL